MPPSSSHHSPPRRSEAPAVALQKTVNCYGVEKLALSPAGRNCFHPQVASLSAADQRRSHSACSAASSAGVACPLGGCVPQLLRRPPASSAGLPACPAIMKNALCSPSSQLASMRQAVINELRDDHSLSVGLALPGPGNGWRVRDAEPVSGVTLLTSESPKNGLIWEPARSTIKLTYAAVPLSGIAGILNLPLPLPQLHCTLHDI